MSDELPSAEDPQEERSDSDIALPQELLDAVPEERRDEFRDRLGRYFLEIRHEEHYSGPLMPSREAAGWDALVPGAAERSFDLYEQQTLKQIESRDKLLAIAEYKARADVELEKKQHEDMVDLTKSVTKDNTDIVKRGQLIGAVGALLIGAGGFLLIYLGHSGWGVATLISELVIFAAVFVYDTRTNRRQLPPVVEAPSDDQD